MEIISDNKWSGIRRSLDTKGFVHIPSVLTKEECSDIISLYRQESLFRSTIDMQRYRFGIGEYKYLNYPLPELIQSYRDVFYTALVPTANDWMEKLESDVRYPAGLQDFLSRCHQKNQNRPTPLILKYERGGYNTLHQDIYGEIFFPFQVVFMLTEKDKDYEGGELVFVEQLPRAQSRSHVLNPGIGDAVIFTTNFRPVDGMRGFYRARMKHGVSTVLTGLRYTMGLIFHDAA